MFMFKTIFIMVFKAQQHITKSKCVVVIVATGADVSQYKYQIRKTLRKRLVANNWK